MSFWDTNVTTSANPATTQDVSLSSILEAAKKLRELQRDDPITTILKMRRPALIHNSEWSDDQLVAGLHRAAESLSPSDREKVGSVKARRNPHVEADKLYIIETDPVYAPLPMLSWTERRRDGPLLIIRAPRDVIRSRKHRRLWRKWRRLRKLARVVPLPPRTQRRLNRIERKLFGKTVRSMIKDGVTRKFSPYTICGA